jgi:hypothetical protein
MCVPLLLFRHDRTPEWIIQTDTSPFGMGFSIFSNDNVLMGYSQIRFPFNSLEFQHSKISK